MTAHTLSPEETQQIWKETCGQLQLKLTPAVFNTWVVNNPLTTIELIGDTKALCTITSPTAFHSTNFKKNLGSSLEQVLGEIIGREIEIGFKIGTPIFTTVKPLAETDAVGVATSFRASTSQTSSFPRTEQNNQSHQTLQTSPPNSSQHIGQISSPRVEDLFSEATFQSANLDRVKMAAQRAGLKPDYTFDTFAVSTTNEMAHAAATAVSQRPGTAYNPLFLYGGVGVGKTHLMHAIGHNILQNNPESSIIYCTGEEFTNEIVSAIQNKKALKFKDKYRNAQVLMIDDIQFIAGKNTVQEEFFHTFNALTQQAHQIILTSDRPPHEINLMEDRLRSRFEAGLMVDIQQPSFELRTAILLIKTKAANLVIPMETAQLIASKVDSARKIEGILKRLKSAVELQKKELTPEFIETLLDVETPQRRLRLRVSPNDIIKTVANHYRVKQTAMRGKRRVQALVKARHVAMFLLKEELNLPLVEIGRWFSNRDHTTVLHATRKIEDEVTKDSLLQRDISALKMSLSAVSR